MNYRKAVLDNYEFLDEKVYSVDAVDKLLKDWGLPCQNTSSDVKLVEKESKSTHLSLVKQ